MNNQVNAADGVITSEPRPPWVAFLEQWLLHPRHVASVTPSGRQLARLMASALPTDSRCIVELGAGTGAITTALLQQHISPANLLAVELNPVLHRVLQYRFPEIHAACGDARQLGSMVQASVGFTVGQIDAVCSSLGLLTMPRTLQRDILTAAFRVLRPGGTYIQYTYGLRRPLDATVCDELDLTCACAGTAWRNLPPARVYVYARRAPVHADGPIH